MDLKGDLLRHRLLPVLLPLLVRRADLPPVLALSRDRRRIQGRGLSTRGRGEGAFCEFRAEGVLGSPLEPEHREAQGRRPGEHRAPQHHAGEHPQQQRTGGGAERQREEGRQERPREQRGLQRHARYPVAFPHALYALAALGEPAAAVDQVLQPPAGRDHERHPDYGAGYADGAAQGGRAPGPGRL